MWIPSRRVTTGDPCNVLHQAIGILGVNLIYAAFHQFETGESFFTGLARDVVREPIEIDFVDFRGPAFAAWDHRTLLAYLVRAGLAQAGFFSATGATGPPTEILRKKAVVLVPGYFGHVEPAHRQTYAEMLTAALQQLRKELGENLSVPIGILSLSAAYAGSTHRPRESPAFCGSNQKR